MKITLNRRFEVKHLFHGVIAGARQTKEQSVGRHSAGVPVAAFVFIERVSHPAIVPGTAGSNDVQPFVEQPEAHHVRGSLVLDASPNLIGINKGQRELSALWPGAEQQPTLGATSVGWPLRIGKV